MTTLLCIKQEVSDKQNLIPGFIYIVFASVLNCTSALHPCLIANLFLIASLHRLFSIYREELSLAAVFDSAFLLGIGGLFYTPVFTFILIPFISLIILKPFKLREWILVICGLLLPLLLSVALLFLFNQPLELLQNSILSSFIPAHKFVFGKGSFLIHSITALLVFLGLINSFLRAGNPKIKTQKIKNILLWCLLCGASAVFVLNETPFFFGILLIVPISIFIGDFLGNLKNSVLREFLTLLLLGAFVCSNLQAAGYL